MNYRRDEAAAEETVSEIKAMGRKAKAYSASVENWDEDQAMVAEVLKDFGGISILVNNAGIASRGQSVADTDPAEMERVLRVHAFGPHYLCKLVIPQMRQEGRGDIIMISSVVTQHMSARGAPYNTNLFRHSFQGSHFIAAGVSGRAIYRSRRPSFHFTPTPVWSRSSNIGSGGR